MNNEFEFIALSDAVTRRLRDDILAGRFSDGERIVEREIAESLGLSRGPIRDALKQLHAEGLVTITPRRGARVATLTRADAAQTIEVRAVLEPLAVKYLLERDIPDKFALLEARVEDLEKASKDGDWSALVLLDMEFHEAVFELSGSPILKRTWETLRIPLLQTFRMHRTFYDSGDQVVKSHRTLLSELMSEDVTRAQRASSEHVVDLRDQLLPSLDDASGDVDEPEAD